MSDSPADSGSGQGSSAGPSSATASPAGRRPAPALDGQAFLLAEYQRLADSFWKNEEVGEKRVNFLITLVTAVITAAVTLIANPGPLTPSQVSGIVVGACVALLGIGLVTFRRMIRRNDATDDYKRGLDHVRAAFAAADAGGALAGYRPFVVAAADVPARRPRRLWTGGLAGFVVVLDTIIVAAGVAAGLAPRVSLAVLVACISAAVVASLVLHGAYHRSASRPRGESA